MNISDALAFLQLRCRFICIREKTARAWLRGKWRVSVRVKGCETIEAMVIRLAVKAQLQDNFVHPPEPKPKPSKRTKAHLKRLPRESLSVN